MMGEKEVLSKRSIIPELIQDQSFLCRDSLHDRSIVYSKQKYVDDHEEFMLDLWVKIQNDISDHGLILLERATFPNFVDFCTLFSSMTYNPYDNPDLSNDEFDELE